MRRLVLLLSISSYVYALGCAGSSFNSVADDAADAKIDGIRYYDAKPFLLVFSDGKGGLTSEVHFLPDLSEKRSIDPFAFMASNEVTLTFTDGVLTQGLSVVDETLVPKAAVEAVVTLGSAALKLLANEVSAESRIFPPPALYEIALKGDTIQLTRILVVDAEAFSNETPDESKTAAPIKLKAGP